ncbi:MAG: glycine cleavage system protein R [Pseudomonadota bacterium]
MNQYLVLTALGEDRPGIVNQLSKAILEHGGNITESRMSVLGGEFAILLLVNGTQEQIDALQRKLPAIGDDLRLTLMTKQTQRRAPTGAALPYHVQVIAMDHPGIVHKVADFFSSRAINIEELDTTTYPAAHTGAPMFALEMTISVPARESINKLRESFVEFCDELGLDGSLEAAV